MCTKIRADLWGLQGSHNGHWPGSFFVHTVTAIHSHCTYWSQSIFPFVGFLPDCGCDKMTKKQPQCWSERSDRITEEQEACLKNMQQTYRTYLHIYTCRYTYVKMIEKKKNEKK